MGRKCLSPRWTELCRQVVWNCLCTHRLCPKWRSMDRPIQMDQPVHGLRLHSQARESKRIGWLLAAFATVLMLAVAAPPAIAQAPAAGSSTAKPAIPDEQNQKDQKDEKNANRSIWTLDVTAARKQHALEGGYTKKWDLSDLPHYVPKGQVTGTLRIWGSNYLKDGPLGEYWREAFKKFQPGITIEYNLPTAGIGIPAVAAKVADLAVGRPATLMDYLTFEQVFHYEPTEITAATGSFDVYGWSPPFIIAVNKDNPLTQISMKQLDGVFGTARVGGYEGSVWHTDYPYRREPRRISAPGASWGSPENGRISRFTRAGSLHAPTSSPSSRTGCCAAAINGWKATNPTPTTRRRSRRSVPGPAKWRSSWRGIRSRCASPPGPPQRQHAGIGSTGISGWTVCETHAGNGARSHLSIDQ